MRVAAGLGATAAKGVAQGITMLTAAGVGAAVGGTYGAASAATVDANNRQLHPTEANLIKENARRFAQRLYGTEQPSAAQIEAAQAMLVNTAQNAVDNNLGSIVPYSAEADAFLQQLKIEYQQQNGTLTLPATSGQPGGVQQLFYADSAQMNEAWINRGLADPAITGVIVRTPISPPTNPDAPDPNRDRLTGLPLDKDGRYTVRVDLGIRGPMPRSKRCSSTW